MKVHFIRHAQAVERSTGLPDEHRNLTCRGRKRFRQVAVCLKKMEIDPGYIISSPLIRAVQTAEILSETIRFNGELQISADLTGRLDVATLGSILRARSQASEVVIVGHEPELGEVVRTVLRLSSPCNLSKGCVVSLDISIKNSGLTGEMTCLITGGGKAIRKPAEAMERLRGKKEVTP
jgi:phosphohistidine phosphatase